MGVIAGSCTETLRI